MVINLRITFASGVLSARHDYNDVKQGGGIVLHSQYMALIYYILCKEFQ